VPQPWLGVRGYATWQMALDAWVNHGWKPEAALPLIQSRKGVFLTSIAPGSPAALSGLRNGDVIARTGERDISGVEDLTMLLKEAGVGSTVSFKVWRAGAAAPLDFSAVLSGARSPALATAEAELRAARGRVHEMRAAVTAVRDEERRQRAARIEAERLAAALAELEGRRRQAEHRLTVAQARLAEAEARLGAAHARQARPDGFALAAAARLMRPLRASGLEVVGLTPRGASQFGARGGVLVVSVLSGSPAERGGLRAGDVIETAAGKSFTNTELGHLIQNSTEPHLALGVVRGQKKLTVLLPFDGNEEE
ncbi:MAG TPA: PDZ domain-containing protein, partial [Pyrinomonadaceae bacterium]